MKKSIKPLLIILGMLGIAIGTGGAVGLVFARSGQKNVQMTAFEVKNITSAMVSSSDGRKYHVKMDLYLELGNDIIKGLSPYVARKQLTRNLEHLDYDIVAANGGMEYVTGQIISWFVDDIERGRDVGNVYVSNIVTGPHKFYPIPEEDEEYGELVMDAATQRTFNALFKAAN